MLGTIIEFIYHIISQNGGTLPSDAHEEVLPNNDHRLGFDNLLMHISSLLTPL